MATSSQPDVTQLLLEWSKGDRQSLDKLLPVVYQELRRLAQHHIRQERPDHTLQATALVHEVYLKLIDTKVARWENRAHFFAVAAQVMRHILVDLARERRAQKRGGGQKLALDEALERLAAVDARQSRVVELRYFGGLSTEEAAEVLGISARTVKREWRMARAWLHRELRRD